MASRSVFETLKVDSLNYLSELVRDVRAWKLNSEFAPSFRFDCGELRDAETVYQHMKKKVVTQSSHIYVYRLTDQTLIEPASNAFEQFRCKSDGWAISRLNNRSDPVEDPNVLYVGSSQSGLGRQRGHLGIGARRTSSMHLAQWAGVLQGSIELSLLELPEGVSRHIRYFLEDVLAMKLQPLLGRRGTI
jgi:hypothetical protein